MTKDKVLVALNRAAKKENAARLREDAIEKLNSMSDDQCAKRRISTYSLRQIFS